MLVSTKRLRKIAAFYFDKHGVEVRHTKIRTTYGWEPRFQKLNNVYNKHNIRKIEYYLNITNEEALTAAMAEIKMMLVLNGAELDLSIRETYYYKHLGQRTLTFYAYLT